jgi:L,D-transpeptidase YcbB
LVGAAFGFGIAAEGAFLSRLGALAFGICLVVSNSVSGAESVRTLVDGAALPDLRWPDVSDYRRYLDAFYRAHNDALVWIAGGRPTPQAIAVTRLFAGADAKGVNAIDYDGDRWTERLAAVENAPSLETEARVDVELTATLMRYISDLHIGRVNPREVDFFLDVSQKKYDLPQLVSSLIDSSDIAAALEQVEPQFDGYRRLRDALVRYRELAAENFELLSNPVNVPQLAERLRKLGDLQGDEPIEDAVKHFQTRHGLDADGRLGTVTLAALNTPLTKRVEQIQLSLERWRWLPASFDVMPVVVNLPEFRLRAYGSDHKPHLSMDVVVGKSFQGRQTPVFAETMTYVVFRPYWNVPPSIQKNEIEPKAANDPSYLNRNGYERVKGSIRQKPGPNNALGNVKFMFPNPMNIYFHDTSARELFSRTRRDFSHGCVRVSKPAALAEWVLRDDPKWTPQAIENAMTKGPLDAHVNLKRPIPVLILYTTATVREDGTVYFFEDIYGHDTQLADALAAGYPYRW